MKICIADSFVVNDVFHRFKSSAGEIFHSEDCNVSCTMLPVFA